MRKTFTIFILTTLLFFSCSKDDESSSEDPDAELPENEEFLLTQMTGEDEAAFHYEDGLLVKGVGNSASNHDDFHSAFEIKYDENKQVEKVIYDEAIFISKPTDFSFDLTSGDNANVEIHNYNYSNGKLVKITSETGKVIREFEYHENGLVKEETIYQYLDRHDDWVNYKYFYEDGKLESYTEFRYNGYNNITSNGNYKTDDKVNPLYILWKNNQLIIPQFISGISDNNLPFYLNNISERAEDGEIVYKARFDYDEDFPVYYEKMLKNDGGVILEYQE